MLAALLEVAHAIGTVAEIADAAHWLWRRVRRAGTS
jgi:hypothetical protein